MRMGVGVVMLAVTLTAPARIEIKTLGYVYPAGEKVEIPIRLAPHADNRSVMLEIGCVDEEISFLATSRQVDPEDRWVVPAFFVIPPSACVALIVASIGDGGGRQIATTSKEVSFTH
jgi:hypothetical protein